MGGMKGPRSFETAGELADGLHQALSYSREAYDYAAEHVRIGAERAGTRLRRPRPRRVGGHRRVGGLGGGEAARPASSSRSTSPRCRPSSSHGTGSRRRSWSRRRGARRGDIAKARGAVPARVLGEAVAGGDPGGGRREDPQRHPAVGRQPHDPRAVRRGPREAFSGEDVPNVPDIHGQLRLVAERVMPAFEGAVA